MPTTGQADIDALVVVPLLARNLKRIWNLKTLASLLWLDGFTVEAQHHLEASAVRRSAVNPERQRNEPVTLALCRTIYHRQ
jgi:hypothetical protein